MRLHRTMCVNYTTVKRHGLERFNVEAPQQDWVDEIWQDYIAPIIVSDQRGHRLALLASYGMVPQARIAPGVKKFSTMNARSETVGSLRSFCTPWRQGQRCLVPMQRYFEPNYESGKSVRWAIGLKDQPEFAVAGLWRAHDNKDGTVSHSFTQLTVNADEHPLLCRFHKPGDEKRGLVILRPEDYDDWLSCSDPEQSRLLLGLRPAEEMTAVPAPQPPRQPKAGKVNPSPKPENLSLF